MVSGECGKTYVLRDADQCCNLSCDGLCNNLTARESDSLPNTITGGATIYCAVATPARDASVFQW
jgi:hypothetical protein